MRLPDSPVSRYLAAAREEEIRIRAHRYLYASGPDSDWDFEDRLREQAWRPRDISRIVQRQYRHIFGLFRRPREGRASWSDFVHGVLTDASLESWRKFQGFLKKSRPQQYIRLDPRHLQAAHRSGFNDLRLEQLIERPAFVELVRRKHGDECDRYPGFDKIERVEVDVWLPENDKLDPFFERYTELPAHLRVALTEAERPLRTDWDVHPDDYSAQELEDEEEPIDFAALMHE